MKKLFLAGLLLPWLCFAFAQGQTLPQKLLHLYEPLDKAQVQTNYLFDLAVPLAHPSRYNGALNDSNYTNINTFGMLYGELRQGWVATGSGLPDPSVYLSKIKNLQYGNALPMAIMAMQYDRIRPDAFNLNLLTYDGDQVHDVPGRSQSPYFQDTVVAFAALTGKIYHLDQVFSLPADLWFSNLTGAAPDISLDLDDGQGWQTLVAGQEVQAQYTSTGDKQVKVRLQFPGFALYAHSRLTVDETAAEDRSPGMQWPRDLYEAIGVSASKAYLGGFGAATMHIFYNNSNCNGAKRMIRPLIIVEGYEEPGFSASTYDRMFDMLDWLILNNRTENLTDHLYPAEYDLIYVDLADGSDWIQRNAFVVEEVINIVNQMKAASGSTEENVLLGVSMGGICGKYALLDMENTPGIDHDCRLFITYDSPLRGANIPIGVQCLAKFAADNFGESIPIVNSLTQAINAPTPSQLLLYHVSAINGTAEPVNPMQVAFLAELDGLGGLGVRHVALSNGANDGTFLENDVLPGELLFDLNATGELPWLNLAGINFFDVVVTIGAALRATGNYTDTKVMIANVTIHLGAPYDPVYVSEEITCFTKPYDVSPGGNSIIGIAALSLDPDQGGLGAGLIEAGYTIEEASHLYMKHHCFVPTFSAVSTTEPASLTSSVACGSPSRCSNPTTAEINRFTGASEFNQEHVYLDERIALVLVDELVTTAPPPPVNPLDLSPNLNTYFNVGLSIYSPIPTVTIGTSNGKLSINNTGKVAFGGANDQNSPHSMLRADTKCDAIITVEKDARLTIGADLSAKHGVLVVNEGATVHVKSGGTLQVTSGQSQLFIKQGATLILDKGAIVKLESAESNIRIEGDLVVNGDIVYQGSGYFDFNTGHKLVFGPGYNTFSLAGTGKPNRMVRISTLLDIDNGHRLNWSNGLVEMLSEAYLHNGAGLDFTNMTLHGMGTSTAINAYFGGAITLDNCKVEYLDLAIIGEGLHGCNILNSDFSNYNDRQLTWQNGLGVTVRNSNFDGDGAIHAIWCENVVVVYLEGSSFTGHGIPLPGNYDEADLLGSKAAVQLFDAAACLVAGCFFSDNSVGIGATDETRPSNIYVYASSSFIHNDAGIAVFGDATRGAVLSDCSLYSGNTSSIRGRDISLMIDSWNSKIFAIDSDTPNRFLGKSVGPGSDSHVRICYALKGVGGSTMMRNNYWGFDASPNPDPNPLTRLFLQDPSCTVNIAVPVIAPVSSIRIPTCGVPHDPDEDEMKQPGSECNVSTGVSPNAPTVDDQFHLGSYLMRYDNFDAAIEAFRPVAALWQPVMSTYSSNCQQYINISKAFIDANDANTLPRSYDANRSKLASSSMLIAPNPANNTAVIYLSEEEHQIQVWNAQGCLVLHENTTGNFRLETATWEPGLYIVHSISSNGDRKTGNMVVNR